MNITYIIICIAVGLIIRQWRNRNIKGVKTGDKVLIPKGHSIFLFNPYSLTIKKADRSLVKKAESYTMNEDTFTYSKNEVAIIALNFKNAIKRARNILIVGGYDREQATKTIIKKSQ